MRTPCKSLWSGYLGGWERGEHGAHGTKGKRKGRRITQETSNGYLGACSLRPRRRGLGQGHFSFPHNHQLTRVPWVLGVSRTGGDRGCETYGLFPSPPPTSPSPLPVPGNFRPTAHSFPLASERNTKGTFELPHNQLCAVMTSCPQAQSVNNGSTLTLHTLVFKVQLSKTERKHCIYPQCWKEGATDKSLLGC